MAPELFVEDENEEEEKDDRKNSKYTNKVDVYSFGIILIYIVTGSYPKFNMKKVVTGVTPKLPNSIVSWVRELITRCLSLDPGNRPSFAEIFEIMKENNYNLFAETKKKKLAEKEKGMRDQIAARVLKIEAFEYQHKDD